MQSRYLSLVVALAALPAAAQTPNEVGRIPIVMYHSVGDPGRIDSRGLNIRVETFQKQLELMHRAGWYPINVRDLFDPAALAAIPKGRTPVALTFDDARGSQVRYRRDGTLDPRCALGILEAFHKKHPQDWPRRATFYVLPRSQYNPTPFWQPGKEKAKIDFLVDAGYEVGNHSTSHHALTHVSKQRLIFEATFCTKAIQKLNPGATMDTFCLPYGSYPKDASLWKWLLTDGTEHSPYRNKGLLMAWGDESYAPLDKRFEPTRIPRIGVDPGYLERAIARLGRSAQRYVSDGDPETLTVPAAQAKWVSANRPDGERLVVAPAPAPAPKKKTAAAH